MFKPMQEFFAARANREDAIDKAAINKAIGRFAPSWLGPVEYFDRIDSSSTYLLQQQGLIHGRICVAGFQTQGRGQSGRQWADSENKNIAFSLGWAPPPGAVSACVSLVVGVAVAEALRSLGVKQAGLKWPNDLMAGHQKMGGILVESTRQGDQSQYVIGVGVNRKLSKSHTENIETPWTDLTGLGHEIDRTTLISALLVSMTSCLEAFVEYGLPHFEGRWNMLHVFDDQVVDFEMVGALYQGKVLGIDGAGALRMLIHGEVKSFVSGAIKIKY